MERISSPVVGFRSWRYVLSDSRWNPQSEPSLQSMFHDTLWQPGVNQSECVHIGPVSCTHKITYDPPPHSGGHCGFYAYHSPTRMMRGSAPDGIVVGAVVGLGRVIVHHEGWRAERSRVVALGVNPLIPWMRRLADVYGVPLVPLEKLQQYALEHGEQRIPPIEAITTEILLPGRPLPWPNRIQRQQLIAQMTPPKQPWWRRIFRG